MSGSDAAGRPDPTGRPAGTDGSSDPGLRILPPAPVEPGSVGVLGGTFDPIHVGHLAIAEEAREVLGLERVLFVPAPRPPHKTDRPVSDPEHRARMVELAIASEPRFELSRVELDRPGLSYSADTLEALDAEARTAGRRADFTFILSAEAAAGLPTWHDPRRLLSLCRLAVAPRAGRPGLPAGWLAEVFPGLEDRFTLLGGADLAVSATEIRERVRVGRSIRYLVPDAVIEYIGDHGLYRDPPGARDAGDPTGSTDRP